MSDSARAMLAGLLESARLSVPDEVAALLAEQGRALGAENATIYLVDHEQYHLVPLPQTADPSREALSIEATLAGRCFRRLEQQEAENGRVVWLPLLDGLERLGVLQLEFPDRTARVEDQLLEAFAALVTEVVMVKDSYGDLFTVVRRRQPMSLAGEIAWNLMPPLTFGTDRVVVSCVLAPAYDMGGDSFDYAVDDSTARIAVFDAMGHGLQAGLLGTVAIAGYRQARRTGKTLAQTVTAVDAAVADTFGAGHFVTALFVELDLDRGRLAWHSAGHPPPLLLRGSQVVKMLDDEPGLPLGIGDLTGAIAPIHHESLQVGDRVLLYSDGVVEARAADGEFFGIDRLGDLVARQASAGHPAPETMRTLMHAILDHHNGTLQDDATTVLVEWKAGGAQRITP